MDHEISVAVARLSIAENPDEKEGSEQNGNSLKAKYNQLVLDAKEKARQGQLEEALELFHRAYNIHKSTKLEKRIAKLKEFIKEYTQVVEEQKEEEEEEEEEEEDDDGLVEIGNNGYRIAKDIKESLYPYQIDALLWFWKLFKRKQGGILGDDMGLGKTIQVIAFLSGMFDCEHIKTALIVMPVAVIENWEKEFKTWTPGIRVKCFYGTKKERLKNLHKIQQKNGVCLTTYGMVVSNHELLSEDSRGRTFKWDYIILDEGHKIKNPTKTSKGIRSIPAKHHFILSGTPIQNNLKEMWALFDFVCQGQLLGSAKTFKTEFETPIVRARERDASAYEMKIGNEMAKSLRKIINPHFLRRTKAEVLKNKTDSDDVDGSVDQKETAKTPGKATVPKMLTRKNDFIIWLHLSDAQLKIYTDFLKLEEIKELLMSNRSPLAELNVLKKICDHPRLLSAMACSKLGLAENDRHDDQDKENTTQSNNFTEGIAGVSDKILIQESGKLVFLVTLLDNLKAEGHRCLVFSQSRKMLDMIQRVITHRGHKVLRIDGTIRSTADREHLITTFQNNSSYTCFLLTTQVGGVGLTLTGADRVVIFDPSWNPATDAQAVDRAYRIGQTKSVAIYRLITCGSIEEKIYRKQVFKNALSQQATGSSKNPFRYFTSQDLRELFTLDDPTKSKTQLQLSKMHSVHRKSDQTLDKHIDFLHSLDIFGISDHDLIYSQEATETHEETDHAANHEAIQARVLRAQHMVAAESSSGGQPIQSMLPAPYENPKSILKPINIDNVQDESIKKKIQARLHQFEVFKPSRDDTSKRFMTQRINKKPMPAVAPSPEVIDLSTPPITPDKTARVPPTTNNQHNDRNRDTGATQRMIDNQNNSKKECNVTVIADDDDIETSMANMSVTSDEKLSSADYEIDDSSGSDSIPDAPDQLHSSTKLFENNDNQETIQTSLEIQMENELNESPFAGPAVQESTPFKDPHLLYSTPVDSYPVQDITLEILAKSPSTKQDGTELSSTKEDINGTSQILDSSSNFDSSANQLIDNSTNGSSLEYDFQKQTLTTPKEHAQTGKPQFMESPAIHNNSVNPDKTNTTDSYNQDFQNNHAVAEEDIQSGTPQILDSSTSSNASVNQEDSSTKILDESSNTMDDSDVFIQSKDSLHNSSDFPNFQVEMLSASMEDNCHTESRDEIGYKEHSVSSAPNILNNILIESPVVNISNRQQTPRRKSSSKNRRKSVSQRIFNNSDSDDSDEEIVRNSKTPRRVLRIESDDEDDVVGSKDQIVESVNSDDEVNHTVDLSHSENGDDVDDNVDNVGSEDDIVDDDNDDDDDHDDDIVDDDHDDDDHNEIRKRRARRILSDDEEELEPSTSSNDEKSENERMVLSDAEEEDEIMASSSSTPEKDDAKDETGKQKVRGLDSESEDNDNSSANSSSSKDESNEDFEEKTGKEKVKGLDSESEDNSSANSSSSKGESDEDDDILVRKSRVRGLDSTDDESSAASSSDRDSFESESKDGFTCPNSLHHSDVIKVQRCECILDDNEKVAYHDLVDMARQEQEQDKYSALKHLLDALKINSGDLQVHKEALLLVKELGLSKE